MYEQFKHQLITELSNKFKMEDLSIISQQLDIVAYDYDIKRKETSVVIYNSDLPELVKVFLVCKKIEGLSDQTLYNYRCTLQNFFLWIQKSPETISSNDVRVYLYNYQQTKKISNRSLDKVRQTLSSFFHWANDENYIQRNPMTTIKAIKYETKERMALSQIELEYIRQACITKKEKAIIEFMYSIGCRVSEMATVKKSDIDWNKKTVRLFGKGSKYRTSYLNAKAEVALLEYFASRNDISEHVFVSDRRPYNAMHKCGLEKIVRQISQRVSDRVNKKVSPHVFRHTTATTALNNGMPIEDISNLLGHANIATTMIYAKVSAENVQTGHKKHII